MPIGLYIIYLLAIDVDILQITTLNLILISYAKPVGPAFARWFASNISRKIANHCWCRQEASLSKCIDIYNQLSFLFRGQKLLVLVLH